MGQRLELFHQLFSFCFQKLYFWMWSIAWVWLLAWALWIVLFDYLFDCMVNLIYFCFKTRFISCKFNQLLLDLVSTYINYLIFNIRQMLIFLHLKLNKLILHTLKLNSLFITFTFNLRYLFIICCNLIFKSNIWLYQISYFFFNVC